MLHILVTIVKTFNEDRHTQGLPPLVPSTAHPELNRFEPFTSHPEYKALQDARKSLNQRERSDADVVPETQDSQKAAEEETAKSGTSV